MWRVAPALLLSLGALLVIDARAGATIDGFPGAGEPVAAKLARSFPGARDRFINCPGNNRVDLQVEDQGEAVEEEGLVCEFRIVRHQRAISGTATVFADRARWEHARWHLLELQVLRGSRLAWHNCRAGNISGPPQYGQRLRVFGVSCRTAVPLARKISERASGASNLRIPRKFVEAEHGTNTLGFVTTRFRCRGRIEVRPGKPNPYGHETAICRTRFGDRFEFSFDQGS